MVRSKKLAQFAQWSIAVPFITLGGWCLLWPGTVEALSLNPDHYIGTQASRILMGCFGAQAILSGLFAAFSRFTRVTFLVYGSALLPFFWFNYHFTITEPVFNSYMLIDVISNTVMLGLCAVGWRALEPVSAPKPATDK
jgi:hypothetical protein